MGKLNTKTMYFITVYEGNGQFTICRTRHQKTMQEKIKSVAKLGLTYSIFVKEIQQAAVSNY